MIITPRKELIFPARFHVGMKGFFRLRTIHKESGKCRIDTGWFPNTILNAGRNIMASRSDWLNCCQVGTDGTFPPLLADRQAETALGTFHAGTTTITTTTNGQQGSAPYYGWKRRVYRFAAGTVAANLSEVGVGWGTSGSTLISRAPIYDPVLQVPTTITPLADELLEVSYELRYYPPLVDAVGPSVVLDGVTYDTVTRAASVTGDRWSASIGSAMGVWAGVVGDWMAYDGALGSILTNPSGLSAPNDTTNVSNAVYVNNSYQVVMRCPVGSTGWNLGSGIRSVRIRTTAGDYQTSFTSNPGGNTIPKDVTYSMYMQWTMSWAEYV